MQERSHGDYLLRARELELKQLRDERDRSYALLNARVADLQGTCHASCYVFLLQYYGFTRTCTRILAACDPVLVLGSYSSLLKFLP